MDKINKTPSMSAFKDYDIRGIYSSEITEELARRVGAAFGTYCDGGSITLGRDTRISGPAIEAAFQEGAISTGCEIDNYGIIPISILSFETYKNRRKAAAYISASHNPPDHNGIRFRTGDGHGLLYKKTNIIDLYNTRDFKSGSGKTNPKDPMIAIKRYGEFVSDKIQLHKALKIVLDIGNGSACLMGGVYNDLGFKPYTINNTPDGRFPGREPVPSEKTLTMASNLIIKKHADYGVGFDPDADRGMFIDDKGRVITPEKIAIILALNRYKPGDLIIAGLDCSMILEQELMKAGIRVERERVGDVFIANRVKNSGAVLGVERSGHFFIPEFQYSDDPFAASFALGEVLSKGSRLSELVDNLPSYPYIQKGIHYHGDPTPVMDRLLESVAFQEPDTRDGLKITTQSYSVLMRPSNTEPLIRLNIETTKDDLTKLENHFEKIIIKAIKSSQ